MSTDENQRKGKLVEDIVALLHDTPDVQVQKRVLLEGAPDQSPREIDVLLKASVAGYEVRIAIECKNEKKKVGVGQMDAFIGKLNFLGIPASYGIYVSVKGYTKGAVEAAQSAGVRLLQLEGLTPDRLRHEVYSAVQSTAYLMLTWRTLNPFPFVGADSETPQGCIEASLSTQAHGAGMVGLHNILWELWIRSEIPSEIGEHHVFIRLPSDFRLEPKGGTYEVVIATVQVVGHVASLAGKATAFALRNVQTSEVEKAHVSAKYAPRPERLPLVSFSTENELTEFLSSGDIHTSYRVRVPRIQSTTMYWPPTKQALDRIRAMKDRGEGVSFASVEGMDISAAWDGAE